MREQSMTAQGQSFVMAPVGTPRMTGMLCALVPVVSQDRSSISWPF